MRSRLRLLVSGLLLLLPAPARADDDVPLDAAEADAALAILAAESAHEAPPPAAWQRLHDSDGYRALHRREAAMKRDFTDDEFDHFLRAPETIASLPALQKTLAAWRGRGLERALALAHAYLPPGTPIRARVYIVVKPRHNTFVFARNQIFLYLDPTVAAPEWENIVAHELHHIGLGAACPASDAGGAVNLARGFVGGFGEGVAMLAAAGGPDVHPHATSKPDDRARWDRDLQNVDADLAKVDQFLRDLLDGKIKDEAAAMQAAAPFWGVQGAWYTVGWTIATAIERRFGRARLVADLCDPPALLDDYDRAAPANAARFSAALIAGLRATSTSAPRRK